MPVRFSPLRAALRPFAASLTLLAALAVGVTSLTGCGTEVEEGVVAPPIEPVEYPSDY